MTSKNFTILPVGDDGQDPMKDQYGVSTQVQLRHGPTKNLGVPRCPLPPRLSLRFRLGDLPAEIPAGRTLGWGKADQGARIRHPGTQSRSISSLD